MRQGVAVAPFQRGGRRRVWRPSMPGLISTMSSAGSFDTGSEDFPPMPEARTGRAARHMGKSAPSHECCVAQPLLAQAELPVAGRARAGWRPRRLEPPPSPEAAGCFLQGDADWRAGPRCDAAHEGPRAHVTGDCRDPKAPPPRRGR